MTSYIKSDIILIRKRDDFVMASITTAINVQIDKEDKDKASEILQRLGVSMSGLINMTIKQLIMRGGIPFDVSLPEEDIYKYFTKEELDKTSKELTYIENHPLEYQKYSNREDLKKALLSDE